MVVHPVAQPGVADLVQSPELVERHACCRPASGGGGRRRPVASRRAPAPAASRRARARRPESARAVRCASRPGSSRGSSPARRRCRRADSSGPRRSGAFEDAMQRADRADRAGRRRVADSALRRGATRSAVGWLERACGLQPRLRRAAAVARTTASAISSIDGSPAPRPAPARAGGAWLRRRPAAERPDAGSARRCWRTGSRSRDAAARRPADPPAAAPACRCRATAAATRLPRARPHGPRCAACSSSTRSRSW